MPIDASSRSVSSPKLTSVHLRLVRSLGAPVHPGAGPAPGDRLGVRQPRVLRRDGRTHVRPAAGRDRHPRGRARRAVAGRLLADPADGRPCRAGRDPDLLGTRTLPWSEVTVIAVERRSARLLGIELGLNVVIGYRGGSVSTPCGRGHRLPSPPAGLPRAVPRAAGPARPRARHRLSPARPGRSAPSGATAPNCVWRGERRLSAGGAVPGPAAGSGAAGRVPAGPACSPAAPA